MQRFKASLTAGHWPENPEPLVRDDSGDFVLCKDVQHRLKMIKAVAGGGECACSLLDEIIVALGGSE